VLADIAKGHTIGTLGYNDTVPGPLIRFRGGVPATIDLFNDTRPPGDAIDLVDLRLFHALQELPRVGGERFT
jgi:hypothetical protein